MKFLSFFKNIWKWATGDKVRNALAKVDKLVEVALPIVKEIAALTPTRIDDEIIALLEKYRLPVDAYIALPSDQRGAALMAAATEEMKRLYPNLPINQLQSAIQLAVTILKNQ